jgi:signal transduction histidine kinase
LAQQLAMLGIDAETIAAMIPHESDAGKQLARLVERLAAASDYVRAVSHQLHPSVLDDIGLTTALGQMLDDFRAREDVPVRFRSNVDSLSLPPRIALEVFRIAQEALRNVSKHARGSAVSATLCYTRNMLRLSIRDYGPGFDAADVRFQSGLGLVSMQERARAVKGALSIRSIPATGTLLVLRVPVENVETSSDIRG